MTTEIDVRCRRRDIQRKFGLSGSCALELSEIRCSRWYYPGKEVVQAFQPDKAQSQAGKPDLQCVYSDPRVTSFGYRQQLSHGPRPGPADQRQPRVSIGKPGERFQQDGHPFRDAQAADVY